MIFFDELTDSDEIFNHESAANLKKIDLADADGKSSCEYRFANGAELLQSKN